ncbi:MAG: MraY family glycosyltransferase [Bryobacteraceae bacterium]|jgi:UDP-GlcNAc:undecaprenyl-phosphate GlcNAc-1-phosphate transferase
MFSILFVLAVSFLISLVVTPVCRDVCLRRGWVDQPDAYRKVHTRAVPRTGGVAIVISFAAALALLVASPLSGAAVVKQGFPLLWRLLPAPALILAAGLVDDLVGLKPWQKLAAQIAGAALACWGGIGIQAVGGYGLPNWSTIPITVLWLVACTNAFNLIDGLDGLAAGLGLFATLTTCVGALLQNNLMLAISTVPLAGALLGFLRYNFSPATIFLGDGGSQTLGFLLGCYGVVWSQKATTLLGMTAPVMALSVPLLDVALSVLRRLLRGRPVFNADRGHIHHRLLDRGLTPRRATLILYAVSGVGASLSVLQSVVHRQYSGLIVLLFCAAAWAGIRLLGYVEFDEARRIVFGGLFRHLLSARLSMRQFEERLSKAASVEESWDLIRTASAELGFTYSLLRLDGKVWECQSSDVTASECWELRIPLDGSGYARFLVPFQAPVQTMTLTSFAEAIRRDLRSRPQPSARELPAEATTTAGGRRALQRSAIGAD